MSRTRALAVLSSLIAMLAMTVGALAFTTGAAQADPRGPATVSKTASKKYPPVPPSLRVNKGVVKTGVSVRASGRNYAKKEKIYVTVYFRAKGSKKTKVVKTLAVYADKNGKFSVNVRMSQAGQVIIAAKGKTSGKTAAAFVYVINKKKGSGGWVITKAAFSTGLTGGGAGTPALAPASQTAPDGAGLAVAAIGVLGAAGSLLVTRRTIRRRRLAVTAG